MASKDPSIPVVRHLFTVKGFENNLIRESLKQILEAQRDVVEQIRRIAPGIRGTLGQRRRRLLKLREEMRDIINQHFDVIKKNVRGQLREFALLEGAHGGRVLEKAVGLGSGVRIGTQAISSAQLRRMLDLDPYDGRTLSDWWKIQKASTKGDFMRRVQIGVTNGESTNELVARVQGTKANKFKDGVFLGTTAHGVETVVRTAVNQIANMSAFNVFSSNPDITEEYRYVATLDLRTSPICRALDGLVFKYKDPLRRLPPQHPACRSTIVPVIKWDELGITPPQGGERSAQFGEVGSQTTYSGWLRRQPASIQDEALGPARGKLFRARKVALDDMIRTDGRLITLDQLRKAS